MNILDLRKKIEPQVQIVERVILQKQPWYLEVLKVFLAIIIVSTIVWGISKADDLTLPKVEKPVTTSFSVLGTVSSVSTSTITLDIQGTNKLNTNVFDTTTLTTIQTSKYTNLTLGDINQGDKVIIQGTDFEGEVKATRLISFFSTASSTIATSTNATSTLDATTTDATSTSVLDSLTNTVQGVVQNVVDAITGSSSSATSTTDDATSTSDTASSTDATSTATTTIDTSSTSTPDATTSPSVLDSLTNTVQDAVQSVVDVITGGASSSTPDDSSSTPQ